MAEGTQVPEAKEVTDDQQDVDKVAYSNNWEG